MQINIATGDSIINAYQENIKIVPVSPKKEQLKKRIFRMEEYLRKYNCDDETKADFMEHIEEMKQELEELNQKEERN